LKTKIRFVKGGKRPVGKRFPYNQRPGLGKRGPHKGKEKIRTDSKKGNVRTPRLWQLPRREVADGRGVKSRLQRKQTQGRGRTDRKNCFTKKMMLAIRGLLCKNWEK